MTKYAVTIIPKSAKAKIDFRAYNAKDINALRHRIIKSKILDDSKIDCIGIGRASRNDVSNLGVMSMETDSYRWKYIDAEGNHIDRIIDPKSGAIRRL